MASSDFEFRLFCPIQKSGWVRGPNSWMSASISNFTSILPCSSKAYCRYVRTSDSYCTYISHYIPCLTICFASGWLSRDSASQLTIGKPGMCKPFVRERVDRVLCKRPLAVAAPGIVEPESGCLGHVCSLHSASCSIPRHFHAVGAS